MVLLLLSLILPLVQIIYHYLLDGNSLTRLPAGGLGDGAPNERISSRSFSLSPARFARVFVVVSRTRDPRDPLPPTSRRHFSRSWTSSACRRELAKRGREISSRAAMILFPSCSSLRYVSHAGEQVRRNPIAKKHHVVARRFNSPVEASCTRLPDDGETRSICDLTHFLLDSDSRTKTSGWLFLHSVRHVAINVIVSGTYRATFLEPQYVRSQWKKKCIQRQRSVFIRDASELFPRYVSLATCRVRGTRRDKRFARPCTRGARS